MPTIRANGIGIFYRMDGPEGAPVLMLSNSLGTDHGLWDPQMGSFADRFRVVRYDSRGHGRTEVSRGPYRIADLGADAVALLDALGIERVRFCGLSKGGMIGMWIAANAPQRIERLVLCNTSAQIGSPEIWNRRIEAVRSSGMEAVVDAVLDRWFTPAFRARAPQAVEAVRRMLTDTPVEGYAASCAALRDMDLRKAVGSIQAPTLVIAGVHDAATPPEHARWIAAQVPGATIKELDAAHLSNIEAAGAFTAAVGDFLA